MPPKKNEEKISEIIEEALRPIKDAMKDIITNEAIANHIQKLEDKLLSKLENQARRQSSSLGELGQASRDQIR